MGKAAQPVEIPADVIPTYQWQYRKCGRCKRCIQEKDFPGHGPYIYGYWQRRLHYFGRRHPDLAELTDAIEHDEERIV